MAKITPAERKAAKQLAARLERWGGGKSFPEDFISPHTGRPWDQLAMQLGTEFLHTFGCPASTTELLELTDPVWVAKREAWQAEMDRREAVAASHGGVVCKRCGGAGGHDQWPGWTCFDCEGRGWTEPKVA